MEFLDLFLEDPMNSPILVGPPAMPSAFMPYRRPVGVASSMDPNRKTNFRSLNKRVIELMSKVHATTVHRHELKENPVYRHMINERQRREKLKENFKMLHAMLPIRTKNDKLSIVQTAARKLEELKREKGELQRRNEDLVALNVERESYDKRGDRVTMRAEMANRSTSGIDSVIRFASCMKGKGVRIMSMNMCVTPLIISAQVDLPSKQVSGAAEEAVRELREVGGGLNKNI